MNFTFDRNVLGYVRKSNLDQIMYRRIALLVIFNCVCFELKVIQSEN